MNHSANRTLLFCIAVKIAIIGVMPLANAWVEQRNHRLVADTVRSEVGELEVTVEQLQNILADCRDETGGLEAQMIDAEQAERFRDQIVELVRTSDCRLRNLTLGERSHRRWMQDDNPLSDGDFNRFDDEKYMTPYDLESQPLELVVSGSFECIQELLSKTQALPRLFSTQSLEIHTDQSHSEITLQWELKLLVLSTAWTTNRNKRRIGVGLVLVGHG